jgi:hypothetical protein
MATGTGSEPIDVGYELGPLALTLSGAEVKRYAIAARMFGGRFMGDEEAHREGFAAQVVPGNMSLALLSRLVGTAFPRAVLRRLGATYRALIHPGCPLVVRGVVTELHHTDHGNLLECDLVIESGDGERLVTGTASVQLPHAG